MSILISDFMSANKSNGNIVSKEKKCPLKLIGIDNSTSTDEEVLELLSAYVPSSAINALLFDTHFNFYIVFLSDIETVCQIVNKKIPFGSQKVEILPLLDYYVVNNVYPTLHNEDVADIFRSFGNVYEVNNHRLMPNSSKYSHILSGKRELIFLLPADQRDMFIPTNVISLPFTFHVRKFCCACLTEGHSILSCPDIDDGAPVPQLLPIQSPPDDLEVNAEESSMSDYNQDLPSPVYKIEKEEEENTLVDSKEIEHPIQEMTTELVTNEKKEKNENLSSSNACPKFRTKFTPRRDVTLEINI